MADKLGRETSNADDLWDGSWQAAEDRVLENALRATPAQRLAWLEDAIHLAYQSGALPRAEDSDSSPVSPPEKSTRKKTE